jgi:hypothetical protein
MELGHAHQNYGDDCNDSNDDDPGYDPLRSLRTCPFDLRYRPHLVVCNLKCLVRGTLDVELSGGAEASPTSSDAPFGKLHCKT